MKDLNITASLEDYLEAIYEIIEQGQTLKAVNIAKKLNVKRSSVTEALKNLAEKNLILYEKYKPIVITELGIKTSKKIMEKHNILKNFLAKILDVPTTEATSTACKIEHVISDDTLNRFKSFLEFYEKTMPANSDFATYYKITTE